jgi:hypothetical protein
MLAARVNLVDHRWCPAVVVNPRGAGDVAVFPLSAIAGGEGDCWSCPTLSPAQDLPVVVLIDGDRPLLIDHIDDVGFGFGFEGTPK